MLSVKNVQNSLNGSTNGRMGCFKYRKRKETDNAIFK